MAAPYLNDLQELVGINLGVDADRITCKHFFSGAAAYLGDKIIVTLSPVGLAFKLDDNACIRELEDMAIPLRYFPNSPVKRHYILFEDVDSLGDGRVAALFRKSIDHARAGDR